jgi:hypothetical protein
MEEIIKTYGIQAAITMVTVYTSVKVALADIQARLRITEQRADDSHKRIDALSMVRHDK